MDFSHFAKIHSNFHLYFLVILSLTYNVSVCLGTRKLNTLYQPPSMALTYHNGLLLQGNLPISILWYGKFIPAQKSIIVDFLLSLNDTHKDEKTVMPSVSKWWDKIQTYMKKAGKIETKILLSNNQILDESCSLGKFLNKSQISELAHKANTEPGELALVLTAQDVVVEGFCMSKCGFHDSDKQFKSVFIWVGNSVSQCPGQCAWPFHQPIYGPQTAPLGAPNGDVGMDGMVVNIARLLAGTITNPFGNGYYMGSGEAQVEVGSACSGLYGKGAYPGYAGEVLVDYSSGASYNAIGVNGRKYLLPALFDSLSSECSTIV